MTFRWDEAGEVLAVMPDLAVQENRRVFAGTDDAGAPIRVEPPLVLPVPAGIGTLKQYCAALTDHIELGAHLVILMQAGAAALGWFEDGRSVRTKSLKKYVVRGRGKAQPTHLATKGKSRYGSRLRLQNARALLVEINEKLHEWVDEFDHPQHIFYSCPVRTWPELFRATPPPPFPRDTRTIKIPFDLPVPTTDVLLRTYKRMCYGRIV